MHGWIAIGAIALSMFITLLVIAWIEQPTIDALLEDDDRGQS